MARPLVICLFFPSMLFHYQFFQYLYLNPRMNKGKREGKTCQLSYLCLSVLIRNWFALIPFKKKKRLEDYLANKYFSSPSPKPGWRLNGVTSAPKRILGQAGRQVGRWVYRPIREVFSEAVCLITSFANFGSFRVIHTSLFQLSDSLHLWQFYEFVPGSEITLPWNYFSYSVTSN